MSFIFENEMFLIRTDAVIALALCMCFLMLGYLIRRKFPFFERMCLPAPVIGGLLCSCLTLGLYLADIATIEMDTTFQGPAMIAFFTCIGLTGDFKTLKTGGKLMLVYWFFIAVIVVVQMIIPFTVSHFMDISPVYAVLAGCTTMVGGHGNGGAFGSTAESLGYIGATTVGLACATFGVISGSLTGGPLGRRLIEKHGLKPNLEDIEHIRVVNEESNKEGPLCLQVVLKNVTFLAVTMALGVLLSQYISSFLGRVTLPAYVGGMILAIIFRNIDEKTHIININHPLIERINDVMISVYLALAMCSMKLWELASLFIPLLVILACQVLFCYVYTRFVVFPILAKVGKSGYDAAVMCSGFMGHCLGATPNALSNMTAVIERYGPSRKAMLIVPPTGSFLADVVSIPTIVVCFNIAVNMAAR